MTTTKDTSASAHPATPGSTRHHRCDYEFLGLLEQDFGLDLFSLNRAFMGVPATPKKQAIALCEWAIRAASGDVLEAVRSAEGVPPLFIARHLGWGALSELILLQRMVKRPSP